MKIRADPKKQRFPSLRGLVIVQERRGQLHVQSWPRKRGPSKSQKVRDQNAWFKRANQIAKIAPPTQQARAIELTRQTGLYPRDLLLKQMAGGIFEIALPDGRVLKPARNFRKTVMFQGAFLQLAADHLLAPNANQIIDWPTPILDTAGFWNIADPERLTIPAGINAIGLTAGWNGTTSVGSWRNVIAFWKNNLVLSVSDVTSPFTPSNSAVHGVLDVVVGDYFHVTFGRGTGMSAAGDSRTFFSLNVLDAD